jgi:hypothetical protein
MKSLEDIIAANLIRQQAYDREHSLCDVLKAGVNVVESIKPQDEADVNRPSNSWGGELDTWTI